MARLNKKPDTHVYSPSTDKQGNELATAKNLLEALTDYSWTVDEKTQSLRMKIEVSRRTTQHPIPARANNYTIYNKAYNGILALLKDANIKATAQIETRPHQWIFSDHMHDRPALPGKDFTSGEVVEQHDYATLTIPASNTLVDKLVAAIASQHLKEDKDILLAIGEETYGTLLREAERSIREEFDILPPKGNIKA